MTRHISTSIVAIATLFTVSAANASDLGIDSRAEAYEPAPAQAQNWTGPYIAIGMGYEAFRSENTEEYCKLAKYGKHSSCDGNDIVSVIQETFDGKAIVSGRIGYDQQSGGVVYGAFVEGNWLNLDSALGDAEWSYGAGARVGLLCGGALCYINGGWEFIELDGDETLDNPFAGGGLEVSFGNGWGGALEGRYSFRDDNEGGVDVKDVASGRLMLIKKFD